MTEAQRDYLADLALKKGVRLPDVDAASAAWASKKIDELKARDDAVFSGDVDKAAARVYAAYMEVKAEIATWGLEQ